jgi:hypothetical protein
MVGDNEMVDCEAATIYGVNAILVRVHSAGFQPYAADLWQVSEIIRHGL